MGLPLRSPVAKLSCEAATEENRTQVTGKANFSPGITSGLLVTRSELEQNGTHYPERCIIPEAMRRSRPASLFHRGFLPGL